MIVLHCYSAMAGWDKTRRSADVVFLFVKDLADVCGTATQNEFWRPFAVTDVKCPFTA